LKRIQKFPHSHQTSTSAFSQVAASPTQILKLGSTDFLLGCPPAQPMPRLISELDVSFFAQTNSRVWQFAGLLFWQFALSEVQDTIHKRPANIDTDQIAAYPVDLRTDAFLRIFPIRALFRGDIYR